MSAAYVVIGFENVTVDDLQSAMNAEFAVEDLCTSFLGCSLEIEDSRETYRMADNILQAHSLEESNKFLRQFDIMPFATEIRLSCGRGRLLADVLPHLADTIAATASFRLKCRALVRIADGECPFRLYQSGRLLTDFRDDYAAVLKTSRWVPSPVVPLA